MEDGIEDLEDFQQIQWMLKLLYLTALTLTIILG